ncbi:hypothetical protein BBK14_19070 [Parafrankia soli]|uniref:Uncharacterized protein n=1 Tax=Parafrankia soli TaxID=2599596 RepID=A0A1S1Q3W7_9ACTN|nr:DUF6529 family protein [Parafrankia soli]OHV27885.1 hypothetical protein BBK14_19070 [Parafrankia soli]
MTTASERARPATGGIGIAGVLLVGAAVAVSLGVYTKTHDPAGRPLYTLGFSGPLPMKAWFTTAAALLLVVQLTTALWMWGRLPGAGSAPAWAAILHRWSGSAAFIFTLPVAFHCIWSLGFATADSRVFLHSLAGCTFYGAYAAKMIGLRTKGLPGWALPVLGSAVLTALVVLWLTASLWFFTRSGIPHV